MIEWFKTRRDRALGRPAVRTALARWPIGRAIASRHAARLFGLMTGFAHSQMMAAALDLGLFDELAEGPRRSDELAGLADLPQAGATALVAAMVALGLWEWRGRDRIGLSVDGLVVASDPGIRAMIAHHRLLYADLAEPLALLRTPGTGRVGAFWPYRGQGDALGYSRLMAATRGFAAEALAELHDFGAHAHVLDIGGGDGSLAMALAARWPGLALTVADLPAVAAHARAMLDQRGLARVAVSAVDAGEALPAGADAITLLRVLHDLDDAAALDLLRRCVAALAPGGTLIVAEPMARRGRDPVAAYFASYFLAMGSGRLRSAREVTALLRAAGLPSGKRGRQAMLLRVVTSRKP